MLFPQRGEIWWVRLDPTQGSEVRKTRPCMVVTNDELNEYRRTVVVIPLSSSQRVRWPVSVAVTCQGKPGIILVDQIRAVSKQRFGSLIEKASPATIEAALEALNQIMAKI